MFVCGLRMSMDITRPKNGRICRRRKFWCKPVTGKEDGTKTNDLWIIRKSKEIINLKLVSNGIQTSRHLPQSHSMTIKCISRVKLNMLSPRCLGEAYNTVIRDYVRKNYFCSYRTGEDIIDFVICILLLFIVGSRLIHWIKKFR